MKQELFETIKAGNLSEIESIGFTIEKLSGISRVPYMHIGYYDKEYDDFVLLSWRIRNIGRFVESRRLVQEDNGRIKVNNSNYNPKLLSLRINEMYAPEDALKTILEKSPPLYVSNKWTKKIVLYEGQLEYKERATESISTWLRDLEKPDRVDRYDVLEGEIIQKEVSEKSDDEESYDKKSPPKGGKSSESKPHTSSTGKYSSTRQYQDYPSEIIEQAIFDCFLKDEESFNQILDIPYRWTKRGKNSKAGEFEVSIYSDFAKIPSGKTFIATPREMMKLNEDWIHRYSDDEDCETS